MQTAYTDAAGRPFPDFVELATGAIGGLTVTPGLYKWSTSVTGPDPATASNDRDIGLQLDGDLVVEAVVLASPLGV
jgi:hypothetical protein